MSALWRAAETGAEGGEAFDELQYVADQNARDAMDVISSIRGAEGSKSPVDESLEEGGADAADRPDLIGVIRHSGLMGSGTTESLRF